jgi:hypothetical protein
MPSSRHEKGKHMQSHRLWLRRRPIRRLAYTLTVTSAVCLSARADNLQNQAVRGRAADLARGGFGALNGTGITVGQAESGVPNRSTTPGNGTNNLPNGNPNLPGAQLTRVPGNNNISNHASEVAGVILSSNAADPGIARGANIISADNTDIQAHGTGNFGSASIQTLFQNRSTPVVNMSFGAPLGVGNNNGTNFFTPFVDWAAGRYDTLVVVAGNQVNQLRKSPADAYNAITVGATGLRVGAGGVTLSYDQLAAYNRSNTTAPAPGTLSGRIKTDIVAPGGDPGPTTGTPGTLAAGTLRFDNQFHTTAGGVNNPVGIGGSDTYNGREGFNGVTTASAFVQPPGANPTPITIAGTSFAAPLVSGAATLLDQYYLARPGQGFTIDHRLIKAVLLNGASKMNVDGTPLTNAAGAPWTRAAATPAAMGGGMRPAIPGSGGFTAPIQPGLDPNLGTGQLDVVRSLQNYAAGRQGPGVVGPIGWDFNTVANGTLANTIANRYDFSTPVQGLFQATLCWDSPVTIAANPGPGGTWQLDGVNSTSFARGALTDLDLYLFALNPNGTLGANLGFSTSNVDNVEHIYLPNLLRGNYEIDVVAAAAVTADTPYGLAWFTVPEPGSWQLLCTGIGIGLVTSCVRRKHRAVH